MQVPLFQLPLLVDVYAVRRTEYAWQQALPRLRRRRVSNEHWASCAGMVEQFEEKPSAEGLAQLEGVSKNSSAEDPFEASMGIYMFKREVLPLPNLPGCSSASG